MSKDEPVKINGQSLNTMNGCLKPVNKETIDRILSTPNPDQYTAIATGLF